MLYALRQVRVTGIRTSDNLILVKTGSEVVTKTTVSVTFNGTHSKTINFDPLYTKTTPSLPFVIMATGTIHSSKSFRCLVNIDQGHNRGRLLPQIICFSAIIIDQGYSTHTPIIEY